MAKLKINIGSIYSVAKKEFQDNIRNRWITTLILIFVILTIATSYFAGSREADSSSLGEMEDTITVLLSISVILVPLIAIMLGYATISGECESGSLYVVLAYPIRRGEVLLGKFIGLGAVIVFSTIMGFGAGGIIIAVLAGTSEWTSYLLFIGLTIILGLLYLSVSMFFSTLTSKRSTSLGLGVLIFFWSMIFGIIIMAAYLAGGGSYDELLTGETSFPDWVWWAVLLSPMDMNQVAVFEAFGLEEAFGFSVEIPSFMSLGLLVTVQLVWIILPLILAFYAFERRDI
ncbi:MAG: ABC transporter permease [Candidatus Hodarchaeota archaeon]